MNTNGNGRVTNCICGEPRVPGLPRCADCQRDYNASPPEVRAMYDYWCDGLDCEQAQEAIEQAWSVIEKAHSAETTQDEIRAYEAARKQSHPNVEAFGRELPRPDAKRRRLSDPHERGDWEPS